MIRDMIVVALVVTSMSALACTEGLSQTCKTEPSEATVKSFATQDHVQGTTIDQSVEDVVIETFTSTESEAVTL